MSIGLLTRTAARMRSQPRSRSSAVATNPHAQTVSIAMGTQSRVVVVAGASRKFAGIGWVICTIVKETTGVVICFPAGAQFRWLPRVISNENGTRNLNEALNHIQ